MLTLLQFVPSLPFTSHDARAYVSRAFEFTRVFKYEWTVNWKFLPEETFLSSPFSIALLVAHAALLVLFATTRWIKPLGRTPRDLARLTFTTPNPIQQKVILRGLSSDFILTSVLSAVMIGMLCARSLHYQFFAYIAWATPFLLWKAKLHPALQVFIWFGQECAWNVYPSVDITSKIIVGTLAAIVFNVWTATGEDVPETVEEMAQRVLLANAEREASNGTQETIIEEVSQAKQGSKPRKRVRIAETADVE